MIVKVSVNKLKGADVKSGELVKITGPGMEIEESFTDKETGETKVSKNKYIQVSYSGQEKMVKLASQTIENCVDCWGEDTDKWVGQQCTISVVSYNKGKGIVLIPLQFKD